MKGRMAIGIGLLLLGTACLPGGLLSRSSPTAPPLTPAPSPTPMPPLTAAPSPTPVPTAQRGRAGWAVVEECSWSVDELGGFPISLSPDGRWMLTGGRDGFCLHPTEDPTQRRCYAPGEKAGMTATTPGAAAWAPDGKRLAFRTPDALWLLDVERDDLRQLATLGGRLDMAWSPDGEMLALGGEGVIIVAPPGGVAEAPAARYEGIIVGLAWADSATLVYGVRRDGDFVLWSTHSGGEGEPQEVWRAPYFAGNLRVKEVSPDGRTVSLWLTLVDLKRGEEVPVRKEKVFNGLDWSPDGQWWLYAYPVSGEITSRLAIRPAAAPESAEQVVWETEARETHLLDWAGSGGLVLMSDTRTVWFLRLVVRQTP